MSYFVRFGGGLISSDGSMSLSGVLSSRWYVLNLHALCVLARTLLFLEFFSRYTPCHVLVIISPNAVLCDIIVLASQ